MFDFRKVIKDANIYNTTLENIIHNTENYNKSLEVRRKYPGEYIQALIDIQIEEGSGDLKEDTLRVLKGVFKDKERMIAIDKLSRLIKMSPYEMFKSDRILSLILSDGFINVFNHSWFTEMLYEKLYIKRS